MIVKLSVATSTNVEDLVSALEKVVESLAVNTTERVCVSAEVYKPATVTGEAQGGGEASVTGRRQSSEVSIQTVVNAPGSDLEEIEYSVTSSAIQVTPPSNHDLAACSLQPRRSMPYQTLGPRLSLLDPRSSVS